MRVGVGVCEDDDDDLTTRFGMHYIIVLVRSLEAKAFLLLKRFNALGTCNCNKHQDEPSGQNTHILVLIT